MNQNPTHIGTVESVTGNTVSIQLLGKYPSSMPIVDGRVYRIGQIGSFLRIPLGYSNVYGIITQSGVSAIPEALTEAHISDPSLVDARRWLTLTLVGEQVGGRFERGVLQSPTSGDAVHLVTNRDLEVIHGGYSPESAITIGVHSASESLEAQFDLDKLVSRHCAILGATGSGKSNSVSVLVRAIAEKSLASTRILMIDPHGEYADPLAGSCKVFKVGADSSNGQYELKVPFWALPFNELIAIFPGKLDDRNFDYLRGKVLEAKREGAQLYGDIRLEAVTADSPIPFSIKRLWFELDDFERMTLKTGRVEPEDRLSEGDPESLTSNSYPPAGLGNSAPFLNNKAKGILSFLDGMRSRLLDHRYKFLFDPEHYTPDADREISTIDKDLNELFSDWFCNDKPVAIIDLSGIPSEITQTVSGAILKTVYDGLFWGQNTSIGGKSQPALIILDEAHTYIKAGENSISSRTVQAIAKEGRKYGVGLLLVTQRPSELDETVLSQCGSMIALRMSNSNDRSHVSSAMQDELRSLAETLSSLRTGEAIISGEMVHIPSRVRFYLSPNNFKSSNPKASIQWANPSPEATEYEAAVLNWRNQSFT